MGNKNGKSSADGSNSLNHRKSQSVSWSFRYASLKKRTHATMMVLDPYLSIGQWLDFLNLNQYNENFKEYSRVENLLQLTDADIKKLGIRSSTHRDRIIGSLVAVREKHRNFNQNSNSIVQNVNKRESSISSSQNVTESVLRNENASTNNAKTENDLTNNNQNNNRNSYRHMDRCNSVIMGHDAKEMKYETLKIERQKQSKSCGDLIEMESPTTPSEAQEFIALKRALDWELSLDSRDLRSHAWYHGSLPRQMAEEIVQKEGDFLIRDCASQPDNYVLTCRTKITVLHFVINKVLLQAETVYERIQFQFEDDAYDTLADLITFYVGSGKSISAASGARIQFPCNRTYPLSYFGQKVVGSQLHTQMQSGIRPASPLNSPALSNAGIRINSLAHQGSYNNGHSPMSSPPRTKRDNPPRLPSKKQRSQSLTPLQAAITSSMQNAEKYNSADGVIQNTDSLQRNTRRKPIIEHCNSGDGNIQSSDCIKSSVTIEDINQQNSIDLTHCNGFKTIARSTIMETTDHLKFTTHSLPRQPSNNGTRFCASRAFSTSKDIIESALTPSADQYQLSENTNKPPSPPPKPNRALPPVLPKKDNIQKDMTIEQQALHRVASYHASGSDSGNGSGDSMQSSAPGDQVDSVQHRGVIIKNPRFITNSSSSLTLKSLTDFDVLGAEQKLLAMDIPLHEVGTKFDVENFNTLLLPSIDNKPLDADALNTIKTMLMETGPKIIAEHLTRIDIKLILGEVNEEMQSQQSPLDCCGLELLTLPHGTNFRQDLIERTQCLKLLVAVTILTCQTDYERAEILSKWIQVAVDTKTALGNLFGFSALMLGLCMPQILKLENAWHILRQKFTESAFTFEAKLRPTLKSMNDCSNPQAPNTTVPHLIVYILLRDRCLDDILNITTPTNKKPSLVTTCISPWEANTDDFGLLINFLHLDSVRGFLRNFNLFRKNAVIVFKDSQYRMDELLSDAFRTEFHIKFLWGSKGCTSSSEDRHTKLENVLSLMADKFCNTEQNGCAG